MAWNHLSSSGWALMSKLLTPGTSVLEQLYAKGVLGCHVVPLEVPV